VNAITVEDSATVDTQVCLGCGVCVPSCPTDAIALTRRQESEQAA